MQKFDLPQTKRSTLVVISNQAHKFETAPPYEECFAMNRTATYDPKLVVVIGIDLAKDHCDVVGYNERKKRVMTLTNIPYEELFNRLAQMPPALVLMEACKNGSYVATRLCLLGHDARQVPPDLVKAHRAGRHKNDIRDAEYIAQLSYLPDTPYIAPKSPHQMDLRLLRNRYKSLQKVRIQIGNQIHAVLEVRGIPAKRSSVFYEKKLMPHIEAHKENLTPIAVEHLEALHLDYLALRDKEAAARQEIEKFARTDEDAKHLMTIPGIASQTAIALIAHAGDAARFKNSRQFAASIGLVPRQFSTGGVSKLLGITKRGPKDLRFCLVQGAGTILRFADKLKGELGQWVRKMKQSGKKYGVIVCAIAAKLARIAWRILRDKTTYRPAGLQGSTP